MKIDTWPEPAIVAPHCGGFVGGPKKLTKLILFEPAGQKMHIFPMIFNNSQVAPISSILHRCAGVTFSMVSWTCRFCAFNNELNIQWILTISLFVIMRPSKILLSPMVLDTFLLWHQFRFMLMIGFGFLISRVVNFCSFFQWNINIFISTSFGFVCANAIDRERRGWTPKPSRALAVQKCRCA